MPHGYFGHSDADICDDGGGEDDDDDDDDDDNDEYIDDEVMMIKIIIIITIIIIYTIIESVCRCYQTAGRNSCLVVSGDVSNCSYRLQYILSRVRISVRPSIFIYAKNPSKPQGNRVASACVYLNDLSTGHECQRNRRKGALPLSRLGATDPSNLNGDGGVCVCMRARACERVRARARARVCGC